MADSIGKSGAKAGMESGISKEKYAEQNRINTYRILAKYRKRNMLMFSGLLASVCGIYAYSMFAVRQEDFSDFEK
ncbi:Hypothetical predicted protein [Paramuricea clavata]|uniref:Cytochrome c oxidase assembly factor 3 n=1 Tax=Paramuricea clavata TaxID=317549 RepID=A0A6S7HN23_PARCT|nr:Hypothetical predicted protein [Paramuricea clavata]